MTLGGTRPFLLLAFRSSELGVQPLLLVAVPHFAPRLLLVTRRSDDPARRAAPSTRPFPALRD